MQEILIKLDELIKNSRPDYYQKLNPPLNESEVNELEARYNLLLPNDLKELYGWKNGQNSNCYESFINNSEFAPLEDILETAAELTSMIGADFKIENWWNKHWLPIFHNGGGSYICYDLEGTFTNVQGQILEFWKGDNDRNIIAPDLKSFLLQLIDYYETAGVADFDGFFEVNDISGFPKRFVVE